jgi:hypothetical protein
MGDEVKNYISFLPGVASEGTWTSFAILLVPNPVPKKRRPRIE